MAYRYEKEPNGEEALVIDGWQNGIGTDPYSGLQDLRNAQINSIPNEISATIGLGAAMATSGATMGRQIHWAIDPGAGGLNPTYYVLDQDGHVFKLVTSTWTSTGASTTSVGADNQGLAFLPYGNGGSGYLLRFRGANIDAYDGTTWTNAFVTTLTSGVSHYALFAQDNVMYFCNGSTIGSIITTSAFDPSNSGTYTLNLSALQLPLTDTATCLAQQSTNLLVGGVGNAIYPWDRLSTTFNYPIFVASGYIKNMVTANTNAFVFTGGVSGRGRIYITNGTNADLYYKMPDNLTATPAEPYWVWGSSTYPSMHAIWHRDNLIFGVEATTNAGALISGSSDRVFAIDLDSKSLRSVGDFPGGSPSSGTIVIPISPTTSASTGMGFYVGYYDGVSAYGIAQSVTNASGGIQGNYQTEIIPVGTFTKLKTFKQFEYKLSAPLAAGESINVYYNSNLTEGWVQLKNFTTTGLISDVTPVNFQNVQWIQFRLLPNSTPSGSGVRLREIRIR